MKHETLLNLKGKVESFKFDNIMDFVEYTEVVPETNYSRSNPKNYWSGGTFDEAVKQAKTGNAELVTEIFEGVNVISAMIEQEKLGEIRDVAGEYFDVGDVLTGEPEVFRREEFGSSKPVVPVYASFSASCTVTTECIKNRGCAIIALCDELNRSGFIVDLHLVHAVDMRKVKYMTDIAVQLEPLDLDTSAFIIANPLCLRRLWFAALERYTSKSFCHGYGRPDEYDLPDIFETGVSGFYFVTNTHFSYNSENYKTLENAKKHIVNMVEKFKESAEQVIFG